ncbi:MAG: leucyl aminopeptidase [Pseudomonadota bacterium]
MDFHATSGDAAKQRTACVIVGVYNNKRLSAAADELNTATNGLIRRLIDRGDVDTSVGSSLLVTDSDGAQPTRIVITGLGKKTALNRRLLRRALQSALKLTLKTGAVDAVSYLGQELDKELDAYHQARLTVLELGNAMYRFHEFKSGRKPKAWKLKKFGFGVTSPDDGDNAVRGARHAQGIVRGMDLARDLGNTPPNVCSPGYLADVARDIAGHYAKVDVQILDEPDMLELGMGSLLSVGHGSAQPSRLLVLEYRGGANDEAPIALVGKGVTFDTGGTSLKPGPAMDEMKYDMCGAAAVLGALLGAASLNLPLNLLVVVPAAENMPGSRASRPGDIVTSMAGKTIEILNTDAEGRLILCDALTYARQYEPRAIVDVATLTGACVIALGRHNSGLMSNDENLADALLSAGQRADDTAWRLPLGEDYAEQLRSNFADMANIGGREAGTVTAACFLSKFTEGVPWAHLDIAGTAWVTGAKKGGTGRPVPLLTDYLIDAAGARD